MRWPLAALLLGATPAAAAELPPGFARLADVTPDIRQEMRYATAHNFLGRRVDGYEVGDCWLLAEAAAALERAALAAEQHGWRLVVYDCYRPTRAVADFLAWSKDPSEQSMKSEFYPAIDKAVLFKSGYIASRSEHSNGSTVDIGAENMDGTPLDFGTPFDFFGEASWTASDAISADARRNRDLLVDLLSAAGFGNYRKEWWHFTFRTEGKLPPYDLPITD